jgi:hypothetical protein
VYSSGKMCRNAMHRNHVAMWEAMLTDGLRWRGDNER